MATLAIIGTAGRKEDARRINLALYDSMYAEVLEAVRCWGIDKAVSGGAAVADHLAVRAYLEGAISELKLYLPAAFRNGEFVPNPAIRFNPGQTCNMYHKAFSAACGIDSLAEIAAAIRKGARAEVHEGFHRRNSEVADNCTHLVAFTFGNAPVRAASEGEKEHRAWQDFGPADQGFNDAKIAGLRDGGTAHTWTEAWKPKIKRHIHLGILAKRP